MKKSFLLLSVIFIFFSCSKKINFTKNTIKELGDDVAKIYLYNSKPFKLSLSLENQKTDFSNKQVNKKVNTLRNQILFSSSTRGRILFDSLSFIGVSFEDGKYLRYNLQKNNTYKIDHSSKGNMQVFYENNHYSTNESDISLIYLESDYRNTKTKTRRAKGVRIR